MAQSGGGRWTTERHTDSEGKVHTITYLWDGVADRDALLAQRAIYQANLLADAEAAAILGA
jgi:hypothetical protein